MGFWGFVSKSWSVHIVEYIQCESERMLCGHAQSDSEGLGNPHSRLAIRTALNNLAATK